MSDLLTRYKAFAEKSEAKPPTPIEGRWALQDKLQNTQRSTASRSAGHELRNGICITCRPVAVRGHFDPSLHPHDPHSGEFAHTPGVSAAKDVLKLAGKIDLGPDEKLVRSAKVDGEAGGVRMALTEQGGKRTLRFGVGPESYGKANRDEGRRAWDGNPTRAPLSDTDRHRLNVESDALDSEYDSATPARKEEIDKRLVDIREQLTEQDFNGTAKLDEYSMGRLVDRIRPALAEAVEQEKVENDAWAELQGTPAPERVDHLKHIVGRIDPITFSQGVIPGSAWGDVHYSVELDDTYVGAEVRLGVMPKGAPDGWGDDKDWEGRFDPAEIRKLLRLLDQMRSGQGE